MGAKWSTVSTSTYADGSPADDGSETEVNKIKYATIKTDLTDPLDTAIDSIVSKLDQRFTETTTSVSTDYTTVASDHAKILEVTDGAITLLVAATAGAGYRVGVYSSGQATTVGRSSTDTIDGATSVAVTSKVLTWFTVNAAGDGYVTDRVAEVSGLTADSTPDKAADYLLAYDASAGENKKVLMGIASGPVAASVQATTSGRSAEFSSIPSWVTEIVISISGLRTNGTTDVPMIQISDSGGYETTNYLGTVANQSGTTSQMSFGFTLLTGTVAAATWHGRGVLTLLDSATNTWSFLSILGRGDAAAVHTGGGSKALSATLTQVKLQLTGTTDNLNAGSINILYS